MKPVNAEAASLAATTTLKLDRDYQTRRANAAEAKVAELREIIARLEKGRAPERCDHTCSAGEQAILGHCPHCKAEISVIFSGKRNRKPLQ